MFTGIIRHHGTVVSVIRSPHARLVVAIPRLLARGGLPRAVRRGDSVAVNGICLTVTQVQRGRVAFDLLAETWRATTIGSWRAGDRVHVEPALRVGDQVGGHWVMGHVDGVGRVLRHHSGPGGITLTIAAPPTVRPSLAPKGAIAVDGVSLTVGPRLSRVVWRGLSRVVWRGLTRAAFTVFLVPHTAAATGLGARRPGDRVNLEMDPMARYCLGRRRVLH